MKEEKDPSALSVVMEHRQTVLLYSSPNCQKSHNVRLVLIEKNVGHKVVSVDEDNKPAELASYSPYNKPPVLITNEVTLYDTNVIVEYIEERFPHPPLMPGTPCERAKIRMCISQILREWYPVVEIIIHGSSKEGRGAREQMKELILSSFDDFLDESESACENKRTLFDCYVATTLWPLFRDGEGLNYIRGKGFTRFKKYILHLFGRDAFRTSLLGGFSKDLGINSVDDIRDYIPTSAAKVLQLDRN